MGVGELEVVVEAVLDGGADGVLRAREEAKNGLRHDVRRGVAQDVDGVGIVALRVTMASRSPSWRGAVASTSG